MPFYIRKSVKAGPFRFNFSQGGIGVSVGAKGLRVGTGPRGHYIHAGRGGLYYRTSLGNAGQRRQRAVSEPPPAQVTFEVPAVNMIEFESGDVLLMRDENFGEVLDEINAKANQWRLSALFGWLTALLGILVLAKAPPVGIWVLIATLPAWAVGSWFDSYRRSTVLFYDIDGPVEQAYKETIAAFDNLSSCAGKWHIEAGGAINDLTTWKRNAGASHLVKRTATKLVYALPKVIKSNITPPSIHVGKQIIYFMPDVALVAHNSRFGALSYSDLRARWQASRFIEDGHVPHDAKVVDRTWQHPNKNGGPDRRFRNNRQLPVCLYDTLHLQSDSGLSEVLEFSQVGKLASFVAALQALAKAKMEAALAPKAIPPNPTSVSPPVAPSSPVPDEQRRKSGVPAIALIIGGIFGLPIAIAALQNAEKSTRPVTTQADAPTGSGQIASSSSTLGRPAASAAGSAQGSPSPSTMVTPATTPSGSASETGKPAVVVQAPNVDATATVNDPVFSTPASLGVDQELTPDPTIFEALAAAATAPAAYTLDAASQPPAAPYIAPPEPKFAYMKQPFQLRDGPGAKYVPVGAVGQNALLAVLETEGGWVHVSGGPSAMGWVPKELLGQRPVSRQATTPKVQNTFQPPPGFGGRTY
ncbi:DUF4236 domain-containing protein [Rhizobium ruizarguesonis]|uniref:DUF4236 domain-containing protein n=1 Tax=Rhizobium ruizarguesonis TaxID=2081791 RepID=UPI0013E08254|nr:DUF4236 domain-containing protein [Rhizobium ruizarguesonis]NEI82149.1 DUF4236 domain-containing protein [Rhizobium ruizarguesonis]